jgi:hypothetical protein
MKDSNVCDEDDDRNDRRVLHFGNHGNLAVSGKLMNESTLGNKR